MGADRTVLRKEDVLTSWDVITGPPIIGVGKRSMSKETASPLTWLGPDGDKGKFRPLILLGLSANLLGQDLLGQMDAIITIDHLAFYGNKTEQAINMQNPNTWIHTQK